MRYQFFGKNHFLIKIILVIFIISCGIHSKKESIEFGPPLKPIKVGIVSGGANSGKIPEDTTLGVEIKKAAFGKAFAVLKNDGSIFSFGDEPSGGIGELVDKDFIKVVGSNRAFAALKQDGSITAWGNNAYGGSKPNLTETGFIDIISNRYGFAALKENGSIVSWGDMNMGAASGGVNAPTSDGFAVITAGSNSFAAINGNDDSIVVWGNITDVDDSIPLGIFKTITGGAYLYATLDASGNVSFWGEGYNYMLNYPSGGLIDVFVGATYLFPENKYNAYNSVVGIKEGRSLTTWGQTTAPMAHTSTAGIAFLAMTSSAYAAISDEGELTVWGDSNYGGSFTPPSDVVFTKVIGNGSMNGGAFAALTTDGNIIGWGASTHGGTSAPTGFDFNDIGANEKAFTAMKDDGTLVTWGDPTFAGDVFSE